MSKIVIEENGEFVEYELNKSKHLVNRKRLTVKPAHVGDRKYNYTYNGVKQRLFPSWQTVKHSMFIYMLFPMLGVLYYLFIQGNNWLSGYGVTEFANFEKTMLNYRILCTKELYESSGINPCKDKVTPEELSELGPLELKQIVDKFTGMPVDKNEVAVIKSNKIFFAKSKDLNKCDVESLDQKTYPEYEKAFNKCVKNSLYTKYVKYENGQTNELKP